MYNYFQSKEHLIASFMAEEWQELLCEIRVRKYDNAQELLCDIYRALVTFSERHRSLFSDPDAARVFASVFSERHVMLRSQLTELILPYCKGKGDGAFTGEFISESLLCWTIEGRSFSVQYEIIKKIL